MGGYSQNTKNRESGSLDGRSSLMSDKPMLHPGSLHSRNVQAAAQQLDDIKNLYRTYKNIGMRLGDDSLDFDIENNLPTVKISHE